MKKRILYILLGVMLLSNVGMGQVIVNPGYSTIYNGFPKQPGYSVSGCCNEVKSFIDNSTGNSVINAINVGSYKFRVTFTSGPDNGFFDEKDFTIIKATPTLTVTNSPLTYTAIAQSATLSSSVAGSITNIKYNGSTIEPTIAGTYSVTANFEPNDAVNYNSLTGVYAGNLVINKATPSISITNSPVLYNGSAQVADLTPSVPGVFTNKLYNGNSYLPGPVNSGTYSFTTNFTPDDQINYNSLTNYNAGNFIINKSLLTITASNTLTKIYGLNLSNSIISTTDFSVSGGFESVGSVTLTFAPGAINTNDPAGSTSLVTPSLPLPTSGGSFNSNNYNINFVNGLLTVVPKQLMIADPTITKSKEYDKTVTANTTAGTLSGVITVGSVADAVTASAEGSYSTPTVGTAKTITVVYTLAGADKGNYIKPVDKVYTDGEITSKQLTIADPTITKSKEYDKTVTVNLTAGTISGVLTVGSVTDVVTASAVGTYSTSTVGTAKTITVVYTLDGADKDNYIKPADKVYTDGVIAAKQLTIADPTITKSKEYDKTVAVASLTAGALSGVVTAGSVTDAVTASAVGTYSTSTVGTSKTITVVYTLAGADKGNYIKPVDKVYTDGEITSKQLTIADPTITKSKEYDKTVEVSSLTAGALSGVVTAGSVTDAVTASAIGTYSTSTVGTSKTITILYTLDGADKDNYIKPVDKVYTDGVITAKQLTIADPTITKSKEYDKTVTVNLTAGTLSGVVTVTDVVTASAVGIYSTSTVGTAKTITVVYTLDGTDKDNYIKPVDKVYTDGVITAKQLTIADPTITKSKEYDKTLNASTTAGALSGVLTVGSVTDVVTASAVGSYSTSTVGTSKTITVVYTLNGADKDNYIKPVDKVYTDGVIIAKQLTITDPTITKSKEYDRTVTASTTAGTLSGVITEGSVSDVVTASAEGSYSTSTVGTNKTITVVYTLAGSNMDNYIKPVDKVYTDGVIAAKQLTIADPTITKSKEYDKTVTASTTAGALSGVLTIGSVTDVVTASAVGAYSTSTVGTAKTITVVYTLNGADKNNYIKPEDKVYTDGVITAKPIIVIATALDKPYDGNKKAEVTLSDNKIIGDIITTSYTLAEFDTKEIGDNKTVTVTGISLQGLDSLNYSLTNTTATAYANITGTPEAILVLPNAFTPNGDNNNDEFKVAASNTLGKTSFKSLEIYNRNGKLMFRTEDITQGWNGRYDNVLQDMGVYFVKLVKLNKDGQLVVETSPIYLLK